MNKNIIHNQIELAKNVLVNCYNTGSTLQNCDYDILYRALEIINNEIDMEDSLPHCCFEYLKKDGNLYVCSECGREFYI